LGFRVQGSDFGGLGFRSLGVNLGDEVWFGIDSPRRDGRVRHAHLQGGGLARPLQYHGGSGFRF
jgi:hypothetical protein